MNHLCQINLSYYLRVEISRSLDHLWHSFSNSESLIKVHFNVLHILSKSILSCPFQNVTTNFVSNIYLLNGAYVSMYIAQWKCRTPKEWYGMLVSVTQPCGTVSGGGAYTLFYLLLHSLRSRGFTAIWCLILI